MNEEIESDIPAADATTTVLLKRVEEVEHGHHGGAWKVAYADMVTALMALFIVLWILGQDEEVIRNVAGYFRDPLGFPEGGLPALSVGASETPRASGPDLGSVAWNEQARAIREALARIPAFDSYREQIVLSVTGNGLRITLLESEARSLFERGGGRLRPASRELVLAIGAEIAKLPQRISIEGHTDGSRFSARSETSNWELSTTRANAVRSVIEEAGVDERRILEVVGLADRHLYNPRDPADGRNRRVAIVLLSEKAARAHARMGIPVISTNGSM